MEKQRDHPFLLCPKEIFQNPKKKQLTKQSKCIRNHTSYAYFVFSLY